MGVGQKDWESYSLGRLEIPYACWHTAVGNTVCTWADTVAIHSKTDTRTRGMALSWRWRHRGKGDTKKHFALESVAIDSIFKDDD